MGCCIVNPGLVVLQFSQLAYHPAPASIGVVSVCSASVCGSIKAYGHRTAQLQCLAHKELGALTHRHPGSLAHHHHGRRAHGQGTSSFEHGEWWRGEWRVVVSLDVRAVPSQEPHAWSSSSRRLQPGNRRVANWLCGVKAQSAHRHPHIFTDDFTSTTSHSRRTTPLHSTKPTAIMSDNENGEEMVTKPFKFVTGMLPRAPREASENTS